MALNKRVKRRLVLISVLACTVSAALLGLFLFKEWNTARKTEEAYKNGMAAYEAGDYVGALQDLSYALTHRRDDIPLTLALAETRLRNVDETHRHVLGSIKIYEHVLTLDPDNDEALRALMNIYVATNSTANALSVSRRLPAEDREAALARIHVLRKAERLDDALDEVEALRDLDPDDTRWPIIEFQIRSRLEETPNRMLLALADYKESYPNNQAIHYLKIPVLRNAGRSEEAIILAREMANLDTIDFQILLQLRMQLEELRLIDEAKLVLEKAEESADEDSAIAMALVERSWRLGAIQSARSKAQEAVVNFPDELDFYRYDALLSVLDSTNDQEESFARLMDASTRLDTARAMRDAQLIDALRAYSSDDSDAMRSSMDLIETALANNQSNFILHYLDANLKNRSGRLDEAIVLYEKIFMSTEARLAGVRLVEGLLAQQRPQDALPVATRMFRRYPVTGVFLVRARVWLALAESGRDPVSLDTSIKPGSTIYQEMRTAYGQLKDVDPKESARLLPLLYRAAALDRNLQNFEYVREEALTSEHVSSDDLIDMYRLDRRTQGGGDTQFLEKATARGASEFDIELLQLEGVRNNEDREARIQGLMQLVEDMEQGTSGRKEALIKLLPVAAVNLASQGGSTELIAEIYEQLDNNTTASRIILAYPNAWAENPELASKALAQLRESLGEDSHAFIMADARRISALNSDDAAMRSSSIVALDGILRNSPSSIEAMLLLANLLSSGSDPDIPRAAGYLKSALDLRPEQASLYPRLIQMLQIIGDRDGALEYLERYQEVASEDYAAARSRVALLLRQGEIAQAIEDSSSIANATRDPMDRIALAQLYLRQGLTKAALNEYNKVLADEPQNELAIHGKSLLMASMGQIDPALELVNASSSMDATSKLRVRIQLYSMALMQEEALADLQKLLAIAPDDASSWIMAADIRSRMGDEKGARESLEKALDADPVNADAMKRLVPILLANKETWEQARQVVERMSAILPAHASSLALLMDASNPDDGSIEPNQGHMDRSLALTKEYPTSIESWRICWILHSSLGDHAESLRIARNALGNNPGSVLPAQWGIQSAIQAGLWEEALDMAYTARDRKPLNDRLESDLQIAKLCQYQGKSREAVIVLSRYKTILFDDDAIYSEVPRSKIQADLQLPPARRIPERLRSQVMSGLIMSGNVDEAHGLFNEQFDENPVLVENWLSVSVSSDPKIGRKALDSIAPALDQSSGGRFRLAQARLSIADKTMNEEDLASAQRAYDSIADNEEFEPTAIKLLQASLLSTQGDWPGSLTILDETKSMFTDDEIRSFRDIESLPQQSARRIIPRLSAYVMALNNLAYGQTQVDGGDLEDALDNINEAIETAPRSMRAELFDTKATVLSKLELREEAIENLLAALDIAPGRTQFKLRLIMLLAENGEFQRALSLADETLSSLMQDAQQDLKNINELKLLITQIEEMQGQVEKIG